MYYKPFVDWIWGGCLLMGLGGFIAMLDRRYRLRFNASSAIQCIGTNPTFKTVIASITDQRVIT